MIDQLENEIGTDYPYGLTWQKTIPTFHPESAEETADIFARATSHKQKLYISGFGNNIDPVGERFSSLLVIKADRLNQILEIGAQDHYVTVGAGYPVKEVNKELEAHELWFPFGDTNYPGSFGGAVAAGMMLERNAEKTPLSRYLLKVRAVLPDSSIVTPGALTFKSVSGYDISRLFYNSWGTIGMLVTMSFRVVPLSQKESFGHLVLLPVDRERFLRDLRGDSAESEIFRKIKAEYDPDNLLPLV